MTMARTARTLLLQTFAALAAIGALTACYETKPPVSPDACAPAFLPVCGDDGVTYANECEADAAGAAVVRSGPCETGNTCRNDGDCELGAICGGDTCPLDDCPPGAGCAPVPPCAPAVCEVCVCAANVAPVCGVDGITYSNACQARCAHVAVARPEPCDAMCGAIFCENECPYGRARDERGCASCACNPGPECEPVLCDLYCEFGFARGPDGCEVCSCNPPPACPPVACGRDCEFGFVLGPDGCQTCECNPPPTCEPVLCDLYCEFGFQRDPSGCETCRCNPPPPSAMCTADADCARFGADARCDLSRPMCASPGCLPGEPCPPAVCYGVCTGIVDCPVITCESDCEYGYARGADGCQTCECNPPPPAVRLCLSDDSCAPMGEYCDMSVCLAPPCPPGMACPAVCYGICAPTSSGGGSGGTPTPR
jgi:hypothetical protein